MLLFLFRLLSFLPLSVLHALGRVGGRMVYRFPDKYRERLQDNARQAGYTNPAFALESAAQAGAMIMELPKVWLKNEESLAMVVSDDNHVVEAALAEGRGVLYLTPHLGCFEITARYLTRHGPITVMFRPPRKPILAPIMESARNAPGLRAVPANRQGVKEFVKALRKGEAVGMLPDQAPGEGEGVWAPFFGRHAYTMTLAGKLAAQTGVAVIMTAGERLPQGKGWRIHYVRLPDPFPTDALAQATLINQAMETLIRRFPEQYLWSYNRYKTPAGAPPQPNNATHDS
ncbi:lysophospholipid acyltransferase family protein [Neopusillimonas maritima]|jgi:KDO2-lipid IV(A) lauroyltransferase|uniref:Lipid A biosynthesis lauroyl acyltransferase n=1 Tax=Neopusillimonas maritima TaxID=2026239 RepID=A0ABX9MV34_9BURK|nr:lysophospholipid acyltransferase family protein [Neopusillimonas maritima]MBF22457.1 lipid A biosynthesis lauroyl acyltransferase [Pusillimonas sp.]RII82331.1 lipid A biosynthesis lauroyl acyltransferase [Neopusillimonas maritima]